MTSSPVLVPHTCEVCNQFVLDPSEVQDKWRKKALAPARHAQPALGGAKTLERNPGGTVVKWLGSALNLKSREPEYAPYSPHYKLGRMTLFDFTLSDAMKSAQNECPLCRTILDFEHGTINSIDSRFRGQHLA